MRALRFLGSAWSRSFFPFLTVLLFSNAFAAEGATPSSGRIGLAVSTQPEWRIAGLSVNFLGEIPADGELSIFAEPGLSFTAAGSSPNDSFELGADVSASLHWNRIGTGVGLNVSWKALRVSGGKPSVTGVFRAGPSVESLFRVLPFGGSDTGPCLGIRPEAGLFWTFSPSGFTILPDWYFAVGIAVFGRF